MDFFCGARTAHRSQCKELNHAALLDGFNGFLRFSTFFFTKLLKSGRNYWKQICAMVLGENALANRKVLLR
jgi:hypothetical protein